MLEGKELGPFRVEQEIGSGAMGSVYSAVHKETGQKVAIKMISPALVGNETALARFEREANILKQLRHPNIVRLLGVGRTQKTPYFLMEYVDGESLDKILVRRGAFSWEEVCALGRQLCDALQHAHLKGIVHRDLKPSNIMILHDGTVKLTDFGIAKDNDVTALTGANCTVGTASYMSPEQCRGERNITHKSDLYSLGVLFYELLTKEKPFRAESPVEMFLAHVNAPVERPSRRCMNIPVWLDTLICQMLEKKPEQRPFDAAMVGNVLADVEDKAAAMRSAGIDAATARWVDRHKGVRPSNEKERDAVRTLRSAGTGKKLRKKTVPFFDRPWVRALAIITMLGVLSYAFYFLTKPPAPETLHSLAKSAMDDREYERAIRPLQRYLDIYGKRNDAMTQEMRQWNQQVWADQRDYQLSNRFNRKMTPDDEGQRLANEALRRENDGDVPGAKQYWVDLQSHYASASNPDQAAYAWVAQKKLTELESIANQEKKILELTQKFRDDTSAPTSLSPSERMAFEAIRLETFGDLPAARDRWAQLRESVIKDPGERPWLLLAASKWAKLKSESPLTAEKDREFRADNLRKWLTEVGKVNSLSTPVEIRRASAICREIIDLYGRESDAQLSTLVQEAVKKSREIASMPKP